MNLIIRILLLGTACALATNAKRTQIKIRAEGPACPIDDPLEIEAGPIDTGKAAPIFEIYEGSVQG